MRGKVFTRFKSELKKKWAKSQCKNWNLEPDAVRVGRMATTPVPCSCWMCGNPRNHYGNSNALKISEKRRFKEIDI